MKILLEIATESVTPFKDVEKDESGECPVCGSHVVLSFFPHGSPFLPGSGKPVEPDIDECLSCGAAFVVDTESGGYL